MKLDEQSVIVVSHVYATGPAQELEKYLKERSRKLLFIGHPFKYAKDTRSFYNIYKEGRLLKKHKTIKWNFPELITYVKDFLYTMIWSIVIFDRADTYIGINNLNAFAGLLLRKISRAKKVIFYTIDYIPNRFNNKLLNMIYHYIDSYCVKKCDYVWNLSPAMIEQREKKGISPIYKNKQITVPIGTEIDKELIVFNGIERHSIAFMGHLREGQGIDFLISTIPEIVKEIPDIKLKIFGTGPLEDKLKLLAMSLNIKDRIEFMGFIEDHLEMQEKLAKCSVGLAPYVDDANNFTRYTDPGKPKAYMATGLPVIITKVPRIAWDIDKEKAGIAINYDKNELKTAIIKLITKDEIYYEYKRNAIKFAERYEWSKVFDQAFREI